MLYREKQISPNSLVNVYPVSYQIVALVNTSHSHRSADSKMGTRALSKKHKSTILYVRKATRLTTYIHTTSGDINIFDCGSNSLCS